MERIITKDIFISYKNDGCGNQFASRLTKDLTGLGYSVYFNSVEKRGEHFPNRLKEAVAQCKDFILILSPGCIEQLKKDAPVDWVREELLTAKEHNKHIVPILINNAQMPSSLEEMPERLRFLIYVDAYIFPEQYMNSPLSELMNGLKAQRDGNEIYKNVYNGNPDFDIKEEFKKVKQDALGGDIEAMYELAVYYYYGIVSDEDTEIECDYEKAVIWLNKVADSNHILRYNAKNLLARLYYKGIMPREAQSYEKAFELHKEAAPYDEYAATQQAFMQRIGSGCKFDYYKILEFYNEASITDNLAKMALAKFHTQYGEYEKAFELYDSMDVLTPEAEYRMGMLYKEGVLSKPPAPDYIQAA